MHKNLTHTFPHIHRNAEFHTTRTNVYSAVEIGGASDALLHKKRAKPVVCSTLQRTFDKQL